MFKFSSSERTTTAQNLLSAAPVENKNDGSKRRLDEKINELNSFLISNTNIREMIAYFKYRNHKSKQKWKKFDNPNLILESVDTVVTFGETTASVTLSVTGVCLMVILFFTGIVCAVSLGYEIIHEIIKNKNN